MAKDSFFCNLSSDRIEEIIERSKEYVCYAAPGIRSGPAAALKDAVERLGKDMVVVWIDFDEHVMRMGYGELEAVKTLQDAGITVNHAPALRSSLILADGKGFAFTQTPLYLEAEPDNNVRNAIELSRDQVSNALETFFPAPKVKAIALVDNQTKHKIDCYLSVEEESTPINETLFNKVEKSLEEAPPAKFDLARQVRVFEPYLQYVELKLEGAAIQRQRIKIPPSIQNLGIDKEIGERLNTTFDLINKGSELSSYELEKKLNEIRKEYTYLLNKNQGRVMLKSKKFVSEFKKELNILRAMIDEHEQNIETKLKVDIDKSKKQIIDYYIEHTRDNLPASISIQLNIFSGTKEQKEEKIRKWMEIELEKEFDKAKKQASNIELIEIYKDITYETLTEKNFLSKINEAYPFVDWDKPYKEFNAIKEKSSKNNPSSKAENID